jgi:hypothetical protein
LRIAQSHPRDRRRSKHPEEGEMKKPARILIVVLIDRGKAARRSDRSTQNIAEAAGGTDRRTRRARPRVAPRRSAGRVVRHLRIVGSQAISPRESTGALG